MRGERFITLEEWSGLSPEQKREALGSCEGGGAKFNRQKTAAIEWALWTWNPITGCLHGCPYCYARDRARRFPQKFAPVILPHRLAAPAKTRQRKLPDSASAVERMGNRNVFVCSMADLFGKWIPREWIEAVLEAAGRAPQWNYLFLTKFPERLAEFEFPSNAWAGTTVDKQAAVERAEGAFQKVKAGVKWLSCEPFTEELRFGNLGLFDWMVIGGRSKSSGSPEFRPPLEMIAHLEEQARAAGVPLYEKENLLPASCGRERIREYPEERSSAPKLIAAPAPSQRPGISQAFLHLAGVRRVQASEAEGSVGIKASGLAIPYRDLHGKAILDGGTPFYRLRLDKPLEGLKYYQPRGSAVHAYLPPKLSSFPRSGDLLVIEGEFKSMAAIEQGFPAVGLGGFFGYALKGGEQLCPELRDAIQYLAPSRLLFCGDSDTALNLAFSDAALRFAELVAPLPVLLPRIPYGGPKGLDDLVEFFGGEFPDWWRGRVAAAIALEEFDLGSLAVELAQREIEALARLEGAERRRAVKKLLRLASDLGRFPIAQRAIADVAKGAFKISATDFQAQLKLAQSQAPSAIASDKEEQPWADPVSLGGLLLELETALRRFVIVPPHAYTLLPFWIAHTYVFDLLRYLCAN